LRVLFLIFAALLLAACSHGPGEEGYPRLSDVPPRPDATLTPDRTDELTEELRAAGDDAVAHAQQGRRTDAGPAIPEGAFAPDPSAAQEDAPATEAEDDAPATEAEEGDSEGEAE